MIYHTGDKTTHLLRRISRLVFLTTGGSTEYNERRIYRKYIVETFPKAAIFGSVRSRGLEEIGSQDLSPDRRLCRLACYTVEK